MQEKRFIEHLEELRACLIKSLIGLLIGFLISFTFISHVLRLLSRPYLNYLTAIGLPTESALRSLSPADTFQITIYAALLTGLAISSPWIAYQLWRFVSPGLYKHERRYAAKFCTPVVLLFLGGAAFAYFVTLPTAIAFFHRYTTSMGIAPDWTIANYFKFVTTFVICFGVVFELPVVVVIATWLEIATPAMLAKYRRHAIVIIFIVAAIFTPPDVVSQLMMGIPMVVLYEISILASRVVEKNRGHVYHRSHETL